jgi:energy-coupling factor transport system substrate-specific component
VASARAAGTPAGYLLAAQNPDGGLGPGPGTPSSQLFSGWAALGLAAAGVNPQDVVHDGQSLLDYIRGGVASASDPGSVERTILVVHAAGLSPQSFGGRNLVSALERTVRRDGSVSEQVNLTAFAVLALRAAGVDPAPATLGWLVRQQDPDGGFNFATRGGSSDVDDTGAALEALAGAGGRAVGRTRARAIRFLRRQQDGDGGFPSQAGAGSNAQSTAFGVQGLLAAGVDPGSLRRRGSSPLDYLRGLIAGDGHVRYSSTADQTPIWVTAEALLALDAKPLPLAPAPRRIAPPVHHATARAITTRASATSHAPTRPVRARPAPAPRAVRIPARGVPRAPVLNLDRLAVDAGFLTALALAPIGQG